MKLNWPSEASGATRLFGKFLLILVPMFLLSASLGLSLVAERVAQATHNQLSARIGTQAAHIADALGRHNNSALTTVSQDLLSTLLFDPAVLCAEVSERSGGEIALKSPQGLGCVGQEAADKFQIPVGKNAQKVLHIRFSKSEVDATRQNYREFSLVALILGLLVSAGVSYLGFRLIVGRPLKKLLVAIRQSEEKGEPVYAGAGGTDELGFVIRAYNEMQKSLSDESARVLQATAELGAERRRNEELLSKVFQVSPYPFAILDPKNATYRNVNEAWLSVMGYSRQDVIGQTAHSLGIWIDPGERGRFVDLLKVQGSVRAFEARVRTKGGQVLDMLMFGEFVDIDGDNRLFMIADDITELKKAEAARQRHHREILQAKTELEGANSALVQRTYELEAAQENLVRQERLATLGELTATVSHELRNPLAAIRSSVHVAIQKTKDLEIGVDRSLARAERNVVRCDSIISDLLGYAREPQCAPEQIAADEWLQKTLSELDVPENISLNSNFAAPDANLTVAPERIRQVVVNLFENAIQALSDMPETKPRVLTVKTFHTSERYDVVFEDSGPGMESDAVSKVFEPLFSTKSYGCGLGLATAKKIVEKYLGTIHFESEIGIGTTVTMSLPAQHARERAA